MTDIEDAVAGIELGAVGQLQFVGNEPQGAALLHEGETDFGIENGHTVYIEHIHRNAGADFAAAQAGSRIIDRVDVVDGDAGRIVADVVAGVETDGRVVADTAGDNDCVVGVGGHPRSDDPDGPITGRLAAELVVGIRNGAGLYAGAVGVVAAADAAATGAFQR